MQGLMWQWLIQSGGVDRLDLYLGNLMGIENSQTPTMMLYGPGQGVEHKFLLLNTNAVRGQEQFQHKIICSNVNTPQPDGNRTC